MNASFQITGTLIGKKTLRPKAGTTTPLGIECLFDDGKSSILPALAYGQEAEMMLEIPRGSKVKVFGEIRGRAWESNGRSGFSAWLKIVGCDVLKWVPEAAPLNRPSDGVQFKGTGAGE